MLLPGLTASGAALLFGVNAWCLDGKGMVWRETLPVSARDVFTMLAKEYAGKEPAYRVPPKIVETTLRSKTIRKAFAGAPPESIVYLNHPVRFDTRRADELLGGSW